MSAVDRFQMVFVIHRFAGIEVLSNPSSESLRNDRTLKFIAFVGIAALQHVHSKVYTVQYVACTIALFSVNHAIIPFCQIKHYRGCY